MSPMGLDWNWMEYALMAFNMCTGGQKQKQMCVYNARISYLCPLGDARRNDTSKTMRTASSKFSDSKYYSP